MTLATPHSPAALMMSLWSLLCPWEQILIYLYLLGFLGFNPHGTQRLFQVVLRVYF